MIEVVASPVALVPYWTYLIPVFIALVGCIQVWGLAYISRRIDRGTIATEKTTAAVNTMEAQINSNMEKQIRQAIAEAIAQERLRARAERDQRSPLPVEVVSGPGVDKPLKVAAEMENKKLKEGT
jgi:hypothetical protein